MPSLNLELLYMIKILFVSLMGFFIKGTIHLWEKVTYIWEKEL